MVYLAERLDLFTDGTSAPTGELYAMKIINRI